MNKQERILELERAINLTRIIISRRGSALHADKFLRARLYNMQIELKELKCQKSEKKMQ